MINNCMKHFIYKTIHTNGKYYIGRHSTENLDDGYIGSGKWPLSIKDKSTLTREILEFVDDFETLKQREGEYLTEHYGKPNCMNQNIDPVGFSTGKNNPMLNPEVVAKIAGDNHWSKQNPEKFRERLAGDNHWMSKNPERKEDFIKNNPNLDGRNAKLAYANGKHNSITNNPSTVNAEKGTHHWQNGNSPNYQGKLNKKLIEEGKHNFLGPDLNNKRVKERTHNFLGSDANLKRLAEGRHPSQQKITCQHCKKTVSVGMYKRWHDSKCKKANKMITTFDQDIINNLATGLTPVELSLQYKKEGKDIPSTYIKFVRDCVKHNMLEFLEEDSDVDSHTRVSSVATTPKQYEQMQLNKAGINRKNNL